MRGLLLSLVILFELLILLWLVPLILEEFGKKERFISVHKAVFTLNLFYSYLAIDIVISLLTCICLFALSVSINSTDFSPSLWVLKWGGILLVIVFYAIQIPIQLMLKLLWPMLFSNLQRVLPNWLKIKESTSHSTLKDLLFPWIEGMRDTGHWFGLCIVGGTVVPYLGLLTVSAVLSIYRAEMVQSEMVDIILGLLLLLSDWCGALVNFALMLNLLFVSFTE